jgi:hypothetical protein
MINMSEYAANRNADICFWGIFWIIQIQQARRTRACMRSAMQHARPCRQSRFTTTPIRRGLKQDAHGWQGTHVPTDGAHNRVAALTHRKHSWFLNMTSQLQQFAVAVHSAHNVPDASQLPSLHSLSMCPTHGYALHCSMQLLCMQDLV